MTAATLACQITTAANCRRVQPMTFKTAKSRRRHRTDAINVTRGRSPRRLLMLARGSRRLGVLL